MRHVGLLLLVMGCGHVEKTTEAPDAETPDAAEPDAAAPDAPTLPDLPDGLVAWYPMDSIDGTTAIDATGHGHDAMCVDATAEDPTPMPYPDACPTLTPSGRIDHAYAFDGANDILAVSAAAGLNGPTFTVAVWIYLDSDVVQGCFVNKAIRDGGRNSWQACIQPTGAISFRSSDGVEGSQNSVLTSTSMIDRGVWYHIALLWDGSGTDHVKKLYFEGTVQASATSATLQIGFDDHPITIGSDIDTRVITLPLKGRIDDLQIYDRALSDAEIMALAAGRQAARAADRSR